jgi:peptide chain release factor
LPTGLEVLVQDSRSQWQNKKEAQKRLQAKLEVLHANEIKSMAENTRSNHLNVDRGNPVKVIVGKTKQRSYVAKKYREKRSGSNQHWKQQLNE